MERSEILTTMAERKLYGMKAACDKIIGTTVKRQHEADAHRRRSADGGDRREASAATSCWSAAPASARPTSRSPSRACVRDGARGRFFNVVDLVNRLEAETRSGCQGRMVDYLCRMDFVVLDELGYLTFAQSGGQLLFHLVSRLYERTSVIVTTNLAFRE